MIVRDGFECFPEWFDAWLGMTYEHELEWDAWNMGGEL